MRDWTPARLADAAGASVARPGAAAGGPARVSVDSRTLAPGELFVALPGARTDGGAHAGAALAAGAWGVLVAPGHADAALSAAAACGAGAGAVLVAERPGAALAALARAWRRELGARVVAVTGSTGKTTTKDIVAALLAPSLRTVASAQNRNTEIGMPLAILGAEAGTEALVLELAMRGAGQIAELTAICEPDVGVIVNVGPAHIELLGSLEAVAAAKAELIEGLRAGATAVVPAGEPLLEPFLARRPDIGVVSFGTGGDVSVLAAGAEGIIASVRGSRVAIEPGFRAPHLLTDLCAALAAADALGVAPPARPVVSFGALRGERLALADGVTVVNDCYNANPMSMRAALDDLALTAPGRRVAVLGDMLELGTADEERYHRELGEAAAAAGVALLVTVGPRAAWTGESYGDGGEHIHAPDAEQAAALLAPLLRGGDTVLVKGSRGVALEGVAAALADLRRRTAR